MAENEFDDDFESTDTPLPEEEEYHFDDEDLPFEFEDKNEFGLMDEETSDDDDDDFDVKRGSPLEDLMNRLKQEDPKKLALMAGAGIFAFFIVVFGLIQIVGGFSKKATTPANVTTSSIATPAAATTSPAVANAAPVNAVPAPSTNVPQSAAMETPPSIPMGPNGMPLLPSQQQMLGVPTYPATNPTSPSSMPMPGSLQPQASAPLMPSTTTTTTTSAPSAAPVTAEAMLLTARMGVLEQQMGSTDQKINNLEKQGMDNAAQLETLNKGINNIEMQVMELTNTMAGKKQATGEGHHHSKHHHGTFEEGVEKAPAMTAYYVQAIIPGRAWLKDPNDKIITVTVGDPISGYGEVVNIDAKNGVVTTSSGAKIEYGIDQF